MSNEPYGFIYLITNNINGKQYVGQTVQTIEKRFKRHCWKCTTKIPRMPISHAIQKYGKENFSVQELRICFNQEELDEKEIYFSQLFNTMSPNGYNLKVGRGPGHMSEELKKKIGDSNRGKKITEEQRKRLSEAHKGLPYPESNRQKAKERFAGKSISLLGPYAPRKRIFKLINPDGILIETNNLKQLCKNFQLTYGKMSEVINGHKPQHKGWNCLSLSRIAFFLIPQTKPHQDLSQMIFAFAPTNTPVDN